MEGEKPARIGIGDRFVCNVTDRGKALCCVVMTYDHVPARCGKVCIRVLEGGLIGDDGKLHGPGTISDFPADRVAAAIERYKSRPK